MFDKLRFEIWFWYRTKVRSLPPPPDDPTEEQAHEYDLLERGFSSEMNKKLLRSAIKYDLDLSEYPDFFQERTPGTLSPHARQIIRRLLHAEKQRRFEARTLWVTKFWLPLLAALVGIIGALTGLFAVMQKKAEKPEKKPLAIEQLIDVRAAKK